MSTRIKELTRQADAAMDEVARLDAAIAEAVADGVDDATVDGMRSRRSRLILEADSMTDAVAVLEKRAKDPAEKMRLNAVAAGLREAKRKADSYVQSAAAVDAALATVEAALREMQRQGSDLQRALRVALSDNARISNTLPASVRWAAWRASPTLAELSDVPHCPGNKRFPLAESARRVVPQIPEA